MHEADVKAKARAKRYREKKRALEAIQRKEGAKERNQCLPQNQFQGTEGEAQRH